MNNFEMPRLEENKYYVNFQKNKIKLDKDFEFFLISNAKIKYFYVTISNRISETNSNNK